VIVQAHEKDRFGHGRAYGAGRGIGVSVEFTTPLLYKSAYDGAHRTEEEAEKHEDVHANCDTRRLERLNILWLSRSVGLGEKTDSRGH